MTNVTALRICNSYRKHITAVTVIKVLTLIPNVRTVREKYARFGDDTLSFAVDGIPISSDEVLLFDRSSIQRVYFNIWSVKSQRFCLVSVEFFFNSC